jgi:hypothetical protein
MTELGDTTLRALAAGGWSLLVIESLSGLLMLEWTFRVGIRVWRQDVPTAASLAQTDFVTSKVKVKHVAPGRWIFRRKETLFGFHSPFPIRGTIEADDGRVRVVGRHPVGGVLFLLAFGLLALPIGGPLIVVVFYGISWMMEQARFEQDWREVRAVLLPTGASISAT